jgi:hypothetical protein
MSWASMEVVHTWTEPRAIDIALLSMKATTGTTYCRESGGSTERTAAASCSTDPRISFDGIAGPWSVIAKECVSMTKMPPPPIETWSTKPWPDITRSCSVRQPADSSRARTAEAGSSRAMTDDASAARSLVGAGLEVSSGWPGVEASGAVDRSVIDLPPMAYIRRG